jgi:multidrug efflux pump subunit AcrB
MSHKTDNGNDMHKNNMARFFVTYRQLSWVLLIAVLLWGVMGYHSMPQRKDPDIPVKESLVIVPWPGASAEKIEQLVTRRIETAVAQNAHVDKIESISRANVSLVYVWLNEYSNVDVGKEFDDVNQKLQSIQDLPQGAGPIQFVKDFGDTSALMLTVASPKAPESEVAAIAQSVQSALEEARRQDAPAGSWQPFSLVVAYPPSVKPDLVVKPFQFLAKHFETGGIARTPRVLVQPGFVVLDGLSEQTDAQLLAATHDYLRDTVQLDTLHPDAWPPVLIRDPATTRERMAAAAGDRYTYRELDDFTDKIEKAVKIVPQVSKVSRAGLLPENIFLYYSQQRLAAYGLQPDQLQGVLAARNIIAAGGQLDAQQRTTILRPSGELQNAAELGSIAIAGAPGGVPVYLRDVVDISRSYQSPARYLNYYTVRDADGHWRRRRAVTLAIQMRPGNKIQEFSEGVDAALASVRKELPSDLVFARTSDQPLQVKENVELFMNSLLEAIVLVVIVSWIGFWEWRSALLMALSIPITLAMTFGFMAVLGIDIQQVSIASLIVALGLLVDNPVVAGDSIKRELAAGQFRLNATWRGPTRLAIAIIFATITNIVAYLPFLMLKGDTGHFIFSLPIVLACSLVASLIVSNSFIPLLSYYILRPVREEPLEARKKRGFPAVYYRVGKWCIRHRRLAFAASTLFLVLGGYMFAHLKQAFFPTDNQYLSTVDIFLPENASLCATDRAAQQAARIVREAARKYGEEHGKKDVLTSVTTFVGQGGPRFWFSITPESQQPNYAQLILQVKDKHDTKHLAGPIQKALTEQLVGARVDVRQLETGKPIGVPIGVRISGDDIEMLRTLAEKAKAIYRKCPFAVRIRDDWGAPSLQVQVETDPDRANLAGVTNFDVAASLATGMSGQQFSVLREGDKQIPIVARLRPEERGQNLKNVYVFSRQSAESVPIQQVARFVPGLESAVIRRRNQFRTITVQCFPAEGHLPSEVSGAVQKDMEALAASLPAGYRLEVGGEREEQLKGFAQLTTVLMISSLLIYGALAVQFRNGVKPLIVFAAVPYGMVGSLIGLNVMSQPFGFMAFLGIISLVGVIVSHIIVLFDFIEEAHHAGEDFEQAVLDAGLQRLRPIMITVLATVIALFPLAMHGGPLWEPLCYAQIGGLSVATFITLLLVPVIYAIFVYDLKIVKWERVQDEALDGGDMPTGALPIPE